MCFLVDSDVFLYSLLHTDRGEEGGSTNMNEEKGYLLLCDIDLKR